MMKIHLLAAALTLTSFSSSQANPAVAKKPEISVNGGNFIDGKARLDFITRRLGDTTSNQIITINNTGTASLTGLKLVVDGPGKANFKVSKIAKSSLSPGFGTTFQVRFTPSREKPVRATLHILSNDADEKSFDIKLGGRVGVTFTP